MARDLNADGTRSGRPLLSPLPPEVATPAKPPVFHVWVNLGRQASHDAPEYPGLVLAWRRGIDDWEAYVVYVVPQQNSPDTAVSKWVAANQLKPVRPQ
jgi:hypothetical protein